MPYCPRCEQEYEPHVATCADCELPLAPTLEAARAARRAPAAHAPQAAASRSIPEEAIAPEVPEVPFYCPEAGLAEAFEKLLRDEQIPTFRYEATVVVEGTSQHRVAVPPEFATTIVSA